MLGDDIAAALPELRAHAESRMVDEITFTAPGGDPVWDDATGQYTTPAGAVVYAGKCRVRQANPAPQDSDSGETTWAVDRLIVSLPVVGSEAVTNGCIGVVTASARDAALVGLTVSVLAGHFQTDSTARRLPCQVVSRDA